LGPEEVEQVLSASTRIHLIGIGGAGMSALARLLQALGYKVSGSDLKDSRSLRALAREGVVVAVGHRPEAVEGAEAVVVSSAIPPRNVELARARELGLPILKRAEVLAWLASRRRCLAVAGSHGKTTTSSMIVSVLRAGGLAPSFAVGGELNEVGGNAELGQGEVFVVETDESDRSFLLFRPDVAVVTNVDDDHLEAYGSREALMEAFRDFLAGSRLAVVCSDDPGAAQAARESGTPHITVGLDEKAEVRAEEVRLGPEASTFKLRVQSRLLPPLLAEVGVGVPGLQNVRNALAAAAAGLAVGADIEAVIEGLSRFSGVRRRLELVGEVAGVRVLDDYAHHPAEIRASLEAVRLAGPGRLIAVFQPHRFSRTARLGREMGRSLLGADLVVVTEVYAAGEDPIPGVTGRLVLDGYLDSGGRRAVYLRSLSEVKDYLLQRVLPGDVVVTLGAGDVGQVGPLLLEELGGRRSGPA
jgi:UDP-N-acetylmuramate--alanine ligase